MSNRFGYVSHRIYDPINPLRMITLDLFWNSKQWKLAGGGESLPTYSQQFPKSWSLIFDLSIPSSGRLRFASALRRSRPSTEQDHAVRIDGEPSFRKLTGLRSQSIMIDLWSLDFFFKQSLGPIVGLWSLLVLLLPQVEYECARGFRPIGGSPLRSCGPDGAWSAPPPLCARVDCGEIDWFNMFHTHCQFDIDRSVFLHFLW